MDFLKEAKDFVRNPLGIIALFISLIYGFVSLLLSSSAEKLTVAERWPIIIFIVAFPIMVLWTFYKLVTNHHGKLYAPGDFKDDKSFLRTLSPEEQEEKLEKEVNESLGYEEIGSSKVTDMTKSAAYSPRNQAKNIGNDERLQSLHAFREELKHIETSIIRQIAKELNVEASRNVVLGETEANFDAYMGATLNKFTFLEVKAFRSPSTSMMIFDRLLYQAVLADKFLESQFKLIIAIVYFFDDAHLDRIEKRLRQKIKACPVNIELRFIPRSKIKDPVTF
jgi:hypothetical protein